MRQYIGNKIINAKAMTRQEYNDFRGWELPENEKGSDDGYLVEYVDGGKANTTEYKGYVSWSPKEVFDQAYKSVSSMSFGDAMVMLKAGRKVSRRGWNGAGMFIFLVPGSVFRVNRAPLLGIYPEGTEIVYRPHLDMKTVDGQIVTWVASQSDLFCEDWFIVE